MVSTLIAGICILEGNVVLELLLLGKMGRPRLRVELLRNMERVVPHEGIMQLGILESRHSVELLENNTS